ncbi:MAG: hypothetical protein QF632_04470 [Candidatus Woesearchaeota archaeon]|jgi:hypothetical protein|nr:hypothetical protein [Candidatus Woesearchaeota archaeon]|tara:strand:+ start:80 stop:439 length:360 start_codon:yes stop_codon:yes gene_type:complete
MAEETTLIAYNSQEGDRVRVVHVVGNKKGEADMPVYDKDGPFVSPTDPKERKFRVDDVGQHYHVNQLQIYENGDQLDSVDVADDFELSELEESLEDLQDQEASADEVYNALSEIVEELV